MRTQEVYEAWIRRYIVFSGRRHPRDLDEADVRAFLADTSANKRDAIIDKLLTSDAFNDKWTMWLGDLMQNTTAQVTANAQRRTQGRNAFYKYLYWSVAGWKPLNDIANEAIASSGNNYDDNGGSANFIMGGSVTGGPAQDTYDGMLVRSATAFLGMAHYDCVTATMAAAIWTRSAYGAAKPPANKPSKCPRSFRELA